MIEINPDKFIRKAIFTQIDSMVVNGQLIKCYDTRVTGNNDFPNYILLTSQNKEIEKPNKCYSQWNAEVLIEIFTKTSAQGNTGSRLLLNDIEQEVYTRLTPKLIIENFETITQSLTFETQLDTITDTEIIYRSFLRLSLILI